MRNIKFKGKATMATEALDEIGIPHNDGWVEGNLIIDGKTAFIVQGIVDWSSDYLNHEWWVKINIKTASQYTGRNDKEDIEIYEGDTIQAEGCYPGEGWYDTGEHEYSFTDVVKWDNERLAYTCNGYLLSELDNVLLAKGSD